MPPKKKPEPPPVEEAEPVPEEPAEPPDPPEILVTELSTGLQLGLRPKDVSAIWALKDFSSQAKLLTELLSLDQAYPAESQRDIVCDFHIFNLVHAKSICLSPLQGAALYAIMAAILAMAKGERVTQRTRPQEMRGAADCFKEFQALILKHSISAPPDRLAIFKTTEARMLTTFASTTFFKHFLLYQFCINFEREVQTLRVTTSVNKPLPPPDLNIAQLKPKKNHDGDAAELEGESGGARFGEGDGTEDEEIERLVEEKLREYKAKWETMLTEREEKLKQRQQRVTDANPKRKPSKK